MLPVRLGFLPLTDCAVLVAARERGFAAAEQIDLSLVRDMSWATARDRLIYRQVDGAHLLAPLAIAVSLGLGQHQTALAAPFKLNLNGNQIVVSGAIACRPPYASPIRPPPCWPWRIFCAASRAGRSSALCTGSPRMR
jgi:NitT/TauT family transport system ATP-binding protein